MRVANERKRKLGSSGLSGATLTEAAMRHLSKRQKITELNTTVTQWVELTCGCAGTLSILLYFFVA